MLSQAESARLAEERSIAAAAERERVRRLEDHIAHLEKIINVIEEDQPALIEWAEWEIKNRE